MIDLTEFRSRMNAFPQPYMENFDYLWKWKIRTENEVTHILDTNHREETYRRLCEVLPKWQTYRNGGNANPLETLRESLRNISKVYNQIRSYTLLEFDNVPHESLEIIWNELGRVKEFNGNTNERGHYSIISVCKPLLLMWGQTLAFDSRVREHCPRSYGVPRYFSKWTLREWISVMHEFSRHLNNNIDCMEALRNESERRYGHNFIVPYGRFLDIYYWV